MVITFSVILLGLAAFIYPLRRNSFFLLASAMIIGSAYYVETHFFTAPAFHPKTFLLFVVFQLLFINVSTYIAYWVDKRAAQKKAWRIRESDLHMLEFLGGWMGAFVAQKIFHHKTSKKNYQAMYKLMIVMELVAIYVILKILKLL